MSEREFERKVKEWLDKGYSSSEVIHTIECNYLGTCISGIAQNIEINSNKVLSDIGDWLLYRDGKRYNVVKRYKKRD